MSQQWSTAPGATTLEPSEPIIAPHPGTEEASGPSERRPGLIGYAIESRDKASLGDDLEWASIRADQLIVDRTCPTASGLFVTAGFVYQTATALGVDGGDDYDGFAQLRGDIRTACAGWSVGLLVTSDKPGTDPSRVEALCCSALVDPQSTPSHLFELTFSYVGTDDEVRSQSAYGSDALTSPVAAVAWLVNELSDRDQRLEAGDRVFTGGVTTAVPVTEGGSYRVVSSSLKTSADFLAW